MNKKVLLCPQGGPRAGNGHPIYNAHDANVVRVNNCQHDEFEKLAQQTGAIVTNGVNEGAGYVQLEFLASAKCEQCLVAFFHAVLGK